MRLKSLQCPKCCAQLEIDSRLKQTKCEYCGTHIWLERDSLSEKSQCTAEEADELADSIKELIPPLKRLNELSVQKQKACDELLALRKLNDKAKAANDIKLPIVVGASVLILSVVLSLITGAFLFAFIGGVAGVGLYLGLQSSYRSRDEEIEAKEQQLKAISDEIIAIGNDYDFSIVPEAYLNEDAMDHFCDSLKKRRAFSLQQAVNIYEADRHNRELLALQREQIELQRKQIEELKGSGNAKVKNNGGDININVDGLAAAGGLIAAGLAIAKAVKDEL